MFERLLDIVQGGGRLLRAEGQGLLDGARRSATWTVVALVAGGVVLVGIAGLLVSLTALMSAELGWITAVAITSSVVAAVGVVVLLSAGFTARRALAPEGRSPSVQAEVQSAQKQLRGHGRSESPSSSPPAAASSSSSPSSLAGHGSEPGTSWSTTAVDYVSRHPGAVAGGALLVAAVIGPRRSLRIASRTAGVVNLAMKMHDASKVDGSPGRNGHRSTGTSSARPGDERGMPPMTASPPMTGTRWAAQAPVDGPDQEVPRGR